MESKRMRMAMALDLIDEALESQVFDYLRDAANRTKHVQTELQVSILQGVEEVAKEYGLEARDLFGEASMATIDMMKNALDGYCDDYKIEPYIVNDCFIGQKVRFYKFSLIGGNHG